MDSAGLLCNGFLTNYAEIIGYLLFPSAWGSGGRSEETEDYPGCQRRESALLF